MEASTRVRRILVGTVALSRAAGTLYAELRGEAKGKKALLGPYYVGLKLAIWFWGLGL